MVKVRGVRVASRASVSFFQDKGVETATLASGLGVNHVLSGSVRKVGQRGRITAQLIRVNDNAHLWAESYDRELTDIFAVQEEIAQSVVRALKGTLLGEDIAASRSRTTSLEAHNLYLQGEHFYRRRAEGDLELARDHGVDPHGR